MFAKQDAKASILIIDDERKITGLLVNLLCHNKAFASGAAGSKSPGLAGSQAA